MIKLLTILSVAVNLHGYKLVGEVTTIDNNLITVTTEEGNVWAVEGYNMEVGDKVLLFMDTNDTLSIHDDMVNDFTVID